MPASSRSRPWFFSFFANGTEESQEVRGVKGQKHNWPEERKIPINSFAPIEMENDHFKGCMLIIHDTGNEPRKGKSNATGTAGDADSDSDGEEKGDCHRRGVELQIQGVFKQASTVEPGKGMWVGGELERPMEFGWFMKSMVNMCTKFAAKKCEGRLHMTIGDKDKNEKPHCAFPIAQVFTVHVSPPGSKIPRLGSQDLVGKKWQGPKQIHVDTESTYTFVYKTPFLDLCSWELLNVPAVSPLPLEKLLSSIVEAKVFLYDLGVVGKHSDWRKGALVEWNYRRGNPDDVWVEDVGEVPNGDQSHTPLDDASDEGDSDKEEDDEMVLLDHRDDEEEDEHSEGSQSSSEGSEEDDDALSMAESVALVELEGWRPRGTGLESASMADAELNMPYYIEAVDRRQKRRLRVWCVFYLHDTQSGGDFWCAKYINEVRSFCRPRPTLRPALRRGVTRKCHCYNVNALEQFRQVVVTQCPTAMRLRKAVIDAATIDIDVNMDEVEKSGHGGGLLAKAAKLKGQVMLLRNRAATMKTKMKMKAVGTVPEEPDAGISEGAVSIDIPNGGLSPAVSKTNTPSDAVCSPKGARDDGDDEQTALQKLRPRLQLPNRRKKKLPLLPPTFFTGVGNVWKHAFKDAKEGRDAVLREGLLGALHFEGRLCEELVRLSKDGTLRCFMPFDCDKPRLKISSKQIWKVEAIPGLFLGRFHNWQVHTFLRVFIFCAADEAERDEWVKIFTTGKFACGASEPTVGLMNSPQRWADNALLLGDTTRSRRWRPKRRIVLNDREIITAMPFESPSPSVVEGMLEKVLTLRDYSPGSDLVDLMSATCVLKAVRFAGWNQSELLAFWVNVYHCLLFHGRLILGTPKNRKELQRFYARVSYLVGLRPVSLNEIERKILQVPRADRTGQVLQGRLRLRRFCAAFCPCRRNSTGSLPPQIPAAGAPPASSNSGSDELRKRPSDRSLQNGGMPTTVGQASPQFEPSRQQAGKKVNLLTLGVCLPKMQLPQVPWKAHGPGSCLYLGRLAEPFGMPKLDLRVVFCLNRGDLSSSHFVPILNARCVNEQLEEVAKEFLSSFVQVERDADGCPVKVTLPHRCRGVKRELEMNSQLLLRFVWQFLPEDTQAQFSKPSVVFEKYRPAPRPVPELSRFAYTSKDLEVDAKLPPSDELLQKLRPQDPIEAEAVHVDGSGTWRRATTAPDQDIERGTARKATDASQARSVEDAGAWSSKRGMSCKSAASTEADPASPTSEATDGATTKSRRRDDADGKKERSKHKDTTSSSGKLAAATAAVASIPEDTVPGATAQAARSSGGAASSSARSADSPTSMPDTPNSKMSL
eukprot:TRINITY_DN101118_c0_g1_i1.p1 TRINITY_DN101118_c0_g1~~TRINITY_DN101118_c0_g1_i1.p1  ORF type:complete len:1327 (+),score=291.34 TRINITY_DN101118_c0_g1_i1:152-4132(+)